MSIISWIKSLFTRKRIKAAGPAEYAEAFASMPADGAEKTVPAAGAEAVEPAPEPELSAAGREDAIAEPHQDEAAESGAAAPAAPEEGKPGEPVVSGAEAEAAAEIPEYDEDAIHIRPLNEYYTSGLTEEEKWFIRDHTAQLRERIYRLRAFEAVDITPPAYGDEVVYLPVEGT